MVPRDAARGEGKCNRLAYTTHVRRFWEEMGSVAARKKLFRQVTSLYTQAELEWDAV